MVMDLYSTPPPCGVGGGVWVVVVVAVLEVCI